MEARTRVRIAYFSNEINNLQAFLPKRDKTIFGVEQNCIYLVNYMAIFGEQKCSKNKTKIVDNSGFLS